MYCMLDIIDLNSMTAKPTLFQLAKPNKDIICPIKDLMTAEIDGFGLNKIAKLKVTLPSMVMERRQWVKNPLIQKMKKKMLIKVKWNDRKFTNWFIINEIVKNDSDESKITVEADGLPSELGNFQVTPKFETVNIKEYCDEILKSTPWKLGTLDEGVESKYRTFDKNSNKTSVLSLLNTGIESFGFVAIYNEENKTIDIKKLSNVREYRGVVLKRENFADDITFSDTADKMVTRLHVVGSDSVGIESVNPTGLTYLEDFSYFLHPFKRDVQKNIITHSDYMSDELAHGLLDIKEKQDELLPRIKDLQKQVNTGIDELLKVQQQVERGKSEVINNEALLDTAKALNHTDQITQHKENLRIAKDILRTSEERYKNIQDSIKEWEGQIKKWQNEIVTQSLSEKQQFELKSFIFEQEFKNDKYTTAQELYDEAVRQFQKYQKGSAKFSISAKYFMDCLESYRYRDRVRLGEEIKIRSTLYEELYTTMVIGYDKIDLLNGSLTIDLSDNLDDIHALDKLASVIYKGTSASNVIEASKTKWDGITEIRSQVRSIREGALKAVKNKIIAGANESIQIDNRGILVTNPNNPQDMLIIQSGVMALSKDGGETWSTAIDPNGVHAERIVGKLIAGENLLIANESGTFEINKKGLTANIDDIKIYSGNGANKTDVLKSWNQSIADYQNMIADGTLNAYERKKLRDDNETIKSVFSKMIEVFLANYRNEKGENLPDPHEKTRLVEKFNDLQNYLTQPQGGNLYAILDEDHLNEPITVDPTLLNTKLKEYEEARVAFENVIPLKFSKTGIEILKDGIALNYVKNGDVINQINLTEEGTKIKGSKFEVDSKTVFKDDVVMGAGKIKSKDDSIEIDLNEGTIKLKKPLVIDSSQVATIADIEKTNRALDKSIYQFAVEYRHSDSATSLTGDYAWSEIPPAWDENKFMFSRTKIITKDGNVKFGNPVNISGARGRNGNPLTVDKVEYQVSESGSEEPTGEWVKNASAVVASGKYLWTRVTYSDGSHSYSIASPGVQGTKGDDGRSVVSIVPEYYISTSKERQEGGSWSATPQAWKFNSYLWTRNSITYRNSNGQTVVEKTVPVVNIEWEAVNQINVGARNLLLDTSFSNQVENPPTATTARPTGIHSYPSSEFWTIKNNGVSRNDNYGIYPYVSKERFGQDVLVLDSLTHHNYKIIEQDIKNRINVGDREFTLSFDIYVESAQQRIDFEFWANKSLTNEGIIASKTVTKQRNNKWERMVISISFEDLPIYDKPILFRMLAHGVDGAKSFVRKIKLEKGNKATDWSSAEEDLKTSISNIDKDKVSYKQYNQNLNDLSKELARTTAIAENSFPKSGMELHLESYRAFQKTVNDRQVEATDAMTKMDNRVAGIVHTLGEGAADWLFTNTRIRMSDEGVVVGSKSTGNYVLVSDSQVAFFAGNNVPVAYISNGTMKINQAVFVHRIQIGKYDFSEGALNHLTIRYVG